MDDTVLTILKHFYVEWYWITEYIYTGTRVSNFDQTTDQRTIISRKKILRDLVTFRPSAICCFSRFKEETRYWIKSIYWKGWFQQKNFWNWTLHMSRFKPLNNSCEPIYQHARRHRCCCHRHGRSSFSPRRRLSPPPPSRSAAPRRHRHRIRRERLERGAVEWRGLGGGDGR